jgi:hypothetical protein
MTIEKTSSLAMRRFGLRAKYYAPAATIAGVGAGVGAALEYATTPQKAPTETKVKRALLGAALGGVTALPVAAMSHADTMMSRDRIRNAKQNFYRAKQNAGAGAGGWEDFFRQHAHQGRRQHKSENRYPPPPPRGPTMKEHKETLGFHTSPPKTKAEAKKGYRDAAMKHHPDRPGGNEEKMKKVNDAWDNYQKSDEFRKLARALFARLMR